MAAGRRDGGQPFLLRAALVAHRILDGLPLYYAGLTTRARVSINDGPVTALPLDREYRVRVPITVPAQGVSWIIVR